MTDLIPVPMEKPRPPSKARVVVARVADRPLPSRRQIVSSASWWSARLVPLLVRAPILLLAELRPIAVGMGRLARAWSRWAACTELAEAVKKAEGNQRSKDTLLLEKRKSARVKVSLAVVGVLLVAAAALVVFQPLWAGLLGGGVLVTFDAVGRSRRSPAEKAPLIPVGPIREGVPLSTLRAEIAKTLLEEGVEATVVQPVPIPHGWTVGYHSAAAVTDDHLRALERNLQIRPKGITQILDVENSALGELTVSLVDPLAELIPSPDLVPGSTRTIYLPLALGHDAGNEEWSESFLRTHFALIGASQSGKSSGFWQIINELRQCVEVELDAIDFTGGPAFSACRRAFRRRGFDEESALRILRDGVALIKERAAELSRLAEDDDTPDDYDEKHQPSAEHPQRIILIDEFALLVEAAQENKELLDLVTFVLRYGAKTAVNLGLAGQGAGLDDFGSSVIRGQVMLKILCACSRQDVLSLFGKDARDRGFRPDLLEPSDGKDPRDAGKCFAQSARSRTPVMRRFYRLEQHEVRARDRVLGSQVVREVEVVDAVEVPATLAAVELAFGAAGNPDRIATAELLVWLRDAGVDLDERSLAEQLRPSGLRPREERWRPAPKVNPVRGYYLADVRAAIGGLR